MLHVARATLEVFGPNEDYTLVLHQHKRGVPRLHKDKKQLICILAYHLLSLSCSQTLLFSI
jgi:hypothetical protein